MSDGISEVVRARRIEVVDDEGVVRALLSVEHDAVLLTLSDPQGGERMTLSATDESAALEFVSGGSAFAALSSTLVGQGDA